MVSTVAEQKKNFSQRDIRNADTARQLYRMIGRPSEAEFQRILANRLIRNCPVTPLDAKRALAIYGPDIATLKGKMTRAGAAPRAPVFDAVPLPPSVLEHYHKVVLCADFFFVQGHIFLHTVSRDIQFRTVSSVPDRARHTMVKELKAIIRLYETRGFTVCALHVDNEFECIREDMYPVHLDVVATDSHVGEVERSIRTIKERLRATAHGLPFKRVPKLLVIHMVADAVRCLNMFPAANGISTFLSPLSLVTGAPPPDYATLRVELGTYVQLFQDNMPSNTIAARSLGAIALTPTGNAHGDYHFLSLASGCRVARHRWTALPMTDTAIARVEALASHERQPLIQADGLVVEWRPDHPIDDDAYDRDYTPPAHATDAADSLPPDDFDSVATEELADLHADAAVFDDAPPDADVFDNAPPPVSAAVPDQGASVHQHNEHDDADVDDDDALSDEHEDNMDNIHIDTDVDDDDEFSDPDDVPNNDVPSHVTAADEGITDDEGIIDESINDPAGPREEVELDEQDQGAHNFADQGALQQIRHSLRKRANTAARRFRAAMDEPFSSKSYFPHTQLFQADIFRYIMTQFDANIEFAQTMTQMSANAGIKKHGRRAQEALMAEFAQLEDLSVYEPLDPTKLTRAQKRRPFGQSTLSKKSGAES